MPTSPSPRPRSPNVHRCLPLWAVAAVGVWAGAALLVVLAGMWMRVTHLPLLDAVSSGLVDGPAAAWYLLPSVVVMLIGAIAAWLAMRARPA